ncbi:MAG: hypothetical protein RRA92_11145, partial [Gemmatimonadota bacterium]|nr:hypothetical protein [Gemmatimonadota bacterium]
QVRAGWSRFSDDEGCGPDPAVLEQVPGCLTFLPGTRTRSGPAVGALVGVEIPLSPRLSFDVGGQFAWFNLGDYEFEGRSLPDTDATGSAFALRGGAFLFFGP